MSKASDFFQVAGSREVLRSFEALTPLEEEHVDLMRSQGRVLAAGVTAGEDLPHFDRAVMDGYAVKASDTFGCSESQPAYLACSGTVEMGRPPDGKLSGGEALRISTGGMMPEGADAVVMWEYTREEAGHPAL